MKKTYLLILFIATAIAASANEGLPDAGGNNTTNVGTGMSLTYHYKSNFSWRLFCDYDFSKKEYTLTSDPMRFLKTGTPHLNALFETLGAPMNPITYKKQKNLHYFTIGASFAVNF